MHKKTTDRLKQLASAILASKSETDIKVFKEIARDIYEELCILEFLYFQDKAVAEMSKPSDKTVEVSLETEEKETQEPILFSIEEEIGTSESLEDIFIKKEEKEDVTTVSEEPSEHSTATLKEKIEAAKKSLEPSLTDDKKPLNATNRASLNDKLLNSGISVDLNDRIAFVKHLFEGSQEDFNRVLSQLNTFENEEDSKNFILNQVKLDYSWEGREDYEARLLLLIERKFM
ncbi:MAG: hypothetical protein QM486_06080 [Flavobacteriaceae bacterium]